MDAKAVIKAQYEGKVPLIFGHRGASAYAPMNTMPAFELAVEQGVDGIELDVHRSEDGHPVIVHDFTVDATSDGHGHVADMTLSELKALDAGSWFDTRFTGTRIPTLDEVFDTVGQKVIINVEIKSISVITDGIEQLISDCIQRHGMQERVIVSSFNPMTLRRFREIAPQVPIGYLYAPGYLRQLQSLLGSLPHEARHPNHENIDAAYMEKAMSNQHIINAWTVNDPTRAKELQQLGVHGIITDHPDQIIEAIRA